jgi:hypothetical protein
VRCFAVAATRSSEPDGPSTDGLVPLASALGDHPVAALSLKVPKRHRLVVASANHWDLLDRADVYAKLREWLGTRRAGARPGGSDIATA